MPQYQLVSDLLNDFNIKYGDFSFETLRSIIQDEWDNGNIKLLVHCENEGAPKVVEPIQREISLEGPPFGERWIRCSIYTRRDSGHIVPEFKDPFIMDEDARYVTERAKAAWLVLIEQPNDTETQPGQPDASAAGVVLAEQESHPETHSETHSGIPERPTAGNPGRKPRSGEYDDEQHLRDMLELLGQGKAPSVHAAARMVAEACNVKGTSLLSTRRRLSRKFTKRRGTEPPPGKKWSDIVD